MPLYPKTLGSSRGISCLINPSAFFKEMAVMGDITKGIQKMDLKAAGTSLDIDGHLRLLQQVHNRFKSLNCREPTCQARLSIGGATEHLKA
jgi:hypothetical protein